MYSVVIKQKKKLSNSKNKNKKDPKKKDLISLRSKKKKG